MDESLLQFAVTAFVMLIVVINPVAVAPVFVGVTRGLGAAERRALLNRAAVVAFCVALFFLLAGRVMLSYLGVSMHAFTVAGGLLLFTGYYDWLVAREVGAGQSGRLSYNTDRSSAGPVASFTTPCRTSRYSQGPDARRR